MDELLKVQPSTIYGYYLLSDDPDALAYWEDEED